MRKYLVLLISALSFANILSAQIKPAFKPFRVDLGLGMAAQRSEAGGLILYLEPSYTFAGTVKAGIRLEQAFLAMKEIGSRAFTLDYYFTGNHRIRLFAGAGYSYSTTSSSGGCDPGPNTVQTIRNTKNFGAILRGGFEFYHIRFGIDYNFVPSTYVSALDQNSHATSTVIYKNAYFGFKLGVGIGGGRKNEAKSKN